jgi:putative DNA primase/helicase
MTTPQEYGKRPSVVKLDAIIAQKAADKKARDGYLLTNDKGQVLPCEHNAMVLLGAEPAYAELHFDTFLSRMRFGARDWSDNDDLEAADWLQSTKKVARFSLANARNGARLVAHHRQRDSLLEFVENLPPWDGVARIAMAFADAWGADNTAVLKAASANFFIALIARAVRPGAQVDTLWVFEGPQGIRKSRALRSLGGSFHAEISAPIGTTDFARELRGLWLGEIAELDAFRGREASTMKRILSCPVDRFVEKYEKHAVSYSRRVVCVATTNEGDGVGYWTDSSGARRLIPIRCSGDIRLDVIEALRLQWFAEAKHRYEHHETWWEFPPEILAEQEDRQEVDPWENILRDGIANGRASAYAVREDWPTVPIKTTVIARDWLGLPAHLQGRATATRIGKVMRRLNFEPVRIGDKQDRGWRLMADTQKAGDSEVSG